MHTVGVSMIALTKQLVGAVLNEVIGSEGCKKTRQVKGVVKTTTLAAMYQITEELISHDS